MMCWLRGIDWNYLTWITIGILVIFYTYAADVSEIEKEKYKQIVEIHEVIVEGILVIFYNHCACNGRRLPGANWS